MRSLSLNLSCCIQHSKYSHAVYRLQCRITILSAPGLRVLLAPGLGVFWDPSNIKFNISCLRHLSFRAPPPPPTAWGLWVGAPAAHALIRHWLFTTVFLAVCVLCSCLIWLPVVLLIALRPPDLGDVIRVRVSWCIHNTLFSQPEIFT